MKKESFSCIYAQTLIQFLSGPGFNDHEASAKKGEPSVGYSVWQLEKLVAGLPLRRKAAEVQFIERGCDWIWLVMERL